MDIDIKITGFNPEVKPIVRDDNIKAFVTWVFITDKGELKLKGGTVRLKAFGKNSKLILTYDSPAYRTGMGYVKVMFFDNKELYKQLCDFTIDKYCLLTGETRNDAVPEEEINIDEIPDFKA